VGAWSWRRGERLRGEGGRGRKKRRVEELTGGEGEVGRKRGKGRREEEEVAAVSGVGEG